MAIERDEGIRFHEQGTLIAVTRWVSTHDEGLAEWLKNARRAYQIDRANVLEELRIAALLMVDAQGSRPARLGLIDVGGATADDLARWSVWQDPDASRPSGADEEEQTQGNGGKAYMYRLFADSTRIVGVSDGFRNAKGFEGPDNSLERGIPGFVPSRAEGENAPCGSWRVELDDLLKPYRIRFEQLPDALRRALEQRGAFTLVEGIQPKGLYEGRIQAEALVQKVARHDQSTLALEQMRVYAIHDGRILFDGEPIRLEEIAPYPGFERPRILPTPETLPDDSGHQVSTTLGGARPPGRVVLYTSRENMPNAFRRLKPRWKVIYRTQYQMIGSKPISELVPTTPGNQFIYAVVELSALEPDYVTHGRVRPSDGPLVEAVDRFVADAIRELAREINERRRLELDAEQLDEVVRENRMLDRWKDQFLPIGGRGAGSESGEGEGPGGNGGDQPESGLEPYVVELKHSESLRVGVGVTLNLRQILAPVVRDEYGRTVHGVRLAYHSDDSGVLSVDEISGTAVAQAKGACHVWVTVASSGLSSAMVPAEAWVVDHVLLAPRQLEIKVGNRRQVVAEVTSDEGQRSTNVLLNWNHDADDPLIVRIRKTGLVTGNRVGVTRVFAGAGESGQGVWSRVPATVTVVENPDRTRHGEGHPRLLITGRDIDPETGEVREGDPEQPPLWQEPSDVNHNVWWLNLSAPDAAFAFGMRGTRPELWRSFHAMMTVAMVTQVHMHHEYTVRGETEHPEFWASHKAAVERFQIQVAPAMWERLRVYAIEGGEL